MADLINLRRVKKAKARVEKSAQADANRAKQGVAKPVRDLAKARDAKASHDLDAKRLERDKSGE
jgi:Domain of unknown function (DUF4169)